MGPHEPFRGVFPVLLTPIGDDGEVIDVTAGTCVLFTAGWEGQAEISETIRNIYMLS